MEAIAGQAKAELLGQPWKKQALEAEREAARWRINERRIGGQAICNFELLLKRPTSLSHVVVELSASGMLKTPFHLNSHDLYISTSIGIAIYPDDSIAHETLIKHADIAMYSAKDQGRNDFRFFDPGTIGT